jgi:beta-glucanase (GH16 family)
MSIARRTVLQAGGLALLGAKAARAAHVPGFAPSGATLTFADEFDDPDVGRINENAQGGRPGAPAWRSRYRHDRFTIINGEKQIYVDAAFQGTAEAPLGVQPFHIHDGVLSITAARADPVRVKPFIQGHDYTSGCITTELTFAQTYGYFETRARLPAGRGFFPAFWLLPKRVGWPPEIDVFEASGVTPDRIHLGVIPPQGEAATQWIGDLPDFSAAFHVYGLAWTHDTLRWSIDGREVWRTVNTVHEPMYVLANLALGNRDQNFIPDPDATTKLPASLDLDYIRVWQLPG